MDFGSAFDLNKFDLSKTTEKIKEQATKAFHEIREQVEKNVRQDWSLSKQELKSLWQQAGPASLEVARQVIKATEQLSDDLTTEVKAARQRVQDHLVSPEFEAQLDEWIKSEGLAPKFENERSKTDGEARTDFANVNASVSDDPIDAADPFDSKAEDRDGRRARVREKLSFLYRHHCDEVLDTAKKGAFLGSVLGPDAALRFALIAGGLRLGLILGGVTYVVFVKPTGEWMLGETE